MAAARVPRVSWFQAAIATVGAWFIYALIWLFGRTRRRADVGWIEGPLNFPLSPLETAHGVTSEIILLRRRDGSVRYTGWFRTLAEQQRVVYTGFYMTERVPHEDGPCVKVVFPMPNGNATVILRARAEGGALILDSGGGRFGGAGFYRVQGRGPERLRIWRITTLRERFRVYVDDAGVLRCDHAIRFLGLPVLALHYKLTQGTRPSLPTQ